MFTSKTAQTIPNAWNKHILPKLKELMTPSNYMGNGNEPKVHHGSSTWFKPGPVTEPWILVKPKGKSKGVKKEPKETMEKNLNKEKKTDIKLKSNQSKENNVPMMGESELKDFTPMGQNHMIKLNTNHQGLYTFPCKTNNKIRNNKVNGKNKKNKNKANKKEYSKSSNKKINENVDIDLWDTIKDYFNHEEVKNATEPNINHKNMKLRIKRNYNNK